MNLAATPTLEAQKLEPPVERPLFGPILRIAAWFGTSTGLVEGLGLLLFQQINWQRWALMVHVSKEILWISVVLDVLFFCTLSILIALLGHFIKQLPSVKIVVFVLALLTAYDWLEVTQRLDNRACVLMGLGLAASFTRWFANRESKVLRFWNRSLPWLVGATVLVFVWVQGSGALREHRMVSSLPAARADAPNILVVVLDTLRADHVSAYGYPRQTTPNIDRLAREGVRFENAFSASCWSLPSHASLVSGRYEYDHGLDGIDPAKLFMWTEPVLGKYATLGDVLQRQGYRTGAFSANRVYFSANLGFAQGFQRFEDYFHSPTDMFVRTLFGRVFVRRYMYRSWRSIPRWIMFHLGFTTLIDRDEEGSAGYQGPFATRKRAATVNDETLRWIDKDRKKPFFAFLNYFDVHHPYGGPELGFQAPWPKTTRIDRYDAGLKYADDEIGVLLQQLKKRGLADNTLVVITSDHGESLTQHHLESHGKALYAEEIHVPLIFWFPGHLPTGLRVKTTVTNAALASTLAEIGGAQASAGFPIGSLTPLWRNPGKEGQWPPVLAEVSNNQFWGKFEADAHAHVATAVDGPMKSVVTDDWHLIVHKTLGDQLYDQRHDPGEINNLIETPAGRNALISLLPQLQDLLSMKVGAAGSVTDGVQPGNTALQPPLIPAGTSHHATRPDERVNDFFRFETIAGKRLSIHVTTAAKRDGAFDPTVAVEDLHGQLLGTCRNAADDRTPPPGVADRTPNVFDDPCLNDDEKTGDRNAALEVEVPGKPGTQVELLVRVSDWNGTLGLAQDYDLSVRESGSASPALTSRN